MCNGRAGVRGVAGCCRKSAVDNIVVICSACNLGYVE